MKASPEKHDAVMCNDIKLAKTRREGVTVYNELSPLGAHSHKRTSKEADLTPATGGGSSSALFSMRATPASVR
jgi:hypothetical protein